MTLETWVGNASGGFEDPLWRGLLARDPIRHVFCTPEWNRLWWDSWRAGKELRLLEVRRGEDLIGIVPLYGKTEDDRRFLRFVGGIDLTDYLGPICPPEACDEAVDALLGYLQARDDWDVLDAHNLPVPFGFAEMLVDAADRHNLRFEIAQEETSALLLLPGTWDGYLDSLPSKDRHELKRKRRRLDREHPDALFRRSTPESLEADLDLFVGLHRGAEGDKGEFMTDDHAAFFAKVADAFMALGWLRLEFLEVGGRAVAATFGFVYENGYYLYNSAYDAAARRLSPGLMLASELVKTSIDEGLRMFDFLRGPERYKYQLGAQAVPLYNVKVHAR